MGRFKRSLKTGNLAIKIIFQDFEVKLNEIIDDPKLLEDVPIDMILSPCTMKLQNFENGLPKKIPIFIKRTYKSILKNDRENELLREESSNNPMGISDESGELELEISEDLCDMLFQHKTVLIANTAGMGKTTSAIQLAKDLKVKNTFWVIFIDLKQHTKVFVRDDQQQPDITEQTYFRLKLLKLKNIFEEKLFKIFYINKKVIFIIDGFDEISPYYKKFVMNILKTVK